MLSKERWKTTAGFFVIPLLGQLWEEKNYCERRNELSSWRPVALPNRHIHLYLFKLGIDVHVLLSIVMYILSGENITAVFTISRRRWDQNTTQVANRLNRARATYVRLLHVPPWERYLLRGHWRSSLWRGGDVILLQGPPKKQKGGGDTRSGAVGEAPLTAGWGGGGEGRQRRQEMPD